MPAGRDSCNRGTGLAGTASGDGPGGVTVAVSVRERVEQAVAIATMNRILLGVRLLCQSESSCVLSGCVGIGVLY